MTILQHKFAAALRISLIAGLLVGTRAVAAQGAYKMASAAAPSELPPSLEGQLESQGVQVEDPKGTPVCEVWTVKSVSLSGGGGDIYPDLGIGTLIGVIHFSAASTDFRGNSLKPGYYTLRYGTMPQDGNHMGANPYRDFVVLSPLSADPQPNQISNFDSLMKLSEKATTTGHPAVMSLVPATGSTFPSVVQTGDGYTAVELKLAGSKSLPIALVVVGQTTAQT